MCEGQYIRIIIAFSGAAMSKYAHCSVNWETRFTLCSLCVRFGLCICTTTTTTMMMGVAQIMQHRERQNVYVCMWVCVCSLLARWPVWQILTTPRRYAAGFARPDVHIPKPSYYTVYTIYIYVCISTLICARLWGRQKTLCVCVCVYFDLDQK